MTRLGGGTAASPAAVLARRLDPDTSIEQIRGMLLGGYGAGAREGVVMAATRDRQMIGDESTWSRRARTAERTRSARDGWTGVLPRLSRRILKLLITIGVPVLILGVARMLRTDVHATPKRGRRHL